MPAPRKRQLYGLFAIILAGAVAELLAIGGVLSFLTLLAGAPQQEAPGWMRALWQLLTPVSNGNELEAATLFFMVAVVIAASVRLLISWASQRMILGFGHELSVEVQDRILHQPYSFHIAQNTSRIVATLEKVQIIVSGVLLQAMQAAAALVIGLVITAALVSISPLAAAVAALVLVASYMMTALFAGPRLARNSDLIGKLYDRRIQIIQESIGGIRDIIVDHSQRVYLDEFRSADWQFVRSRTSSSLLASAPRILIEAAGMVLIAGLALALASRGQGLTESLPVLGALALGALRLLPLLQQLYQAWTSMASNRSIATEVVELLSLPVPLDPPLAAPLPFSRDIRFKAVGFSYTGRHHAAVADIDLLIPHGARVAIVGRTGSGKSTLVDLLMGLLAPIDGTIEIDGAPLTDANRRSWQRNVAHVAQAIFLADTTVARNIMFGDPNAPVDRDRLAEAVRIAHLDDVIADLADGLDTRIGERGVGLSGGQRQRLGLARAIYKDAPVLILDEATNALDHETETAVLEALAELHDRGRTTIIIGHRLQPGQLFDLVIRLDKGRIVSIERPLSERA